MPKIILQVTINENSIHYAIYRKFLPINVFREEILPFSKYLLNEAIYYEAIPNHITYVLRGIQQ